MGRAMDWMLGRLRFDRKASVAKQERGEAVLAEAQRAIEKHQAIDKTQDGVLADLRALIDTPIVRPGEHLVGDTVMRRGRRR